MWYLFAGVALIVVGALAYYYRQQRSQNEWIPPPQTGEAAPVAAKPSKEELLDISTSPEPPTQQVIFDYAEAVLEGKLNHPSARSLTILGTEDTSIMYLMRDLLLLVQLEEKNASIEAFVFDSRSLVENLITQLSAENPSHSASLRSAPSEDLPLYLSLDANKLSKILSILLQQAIERTDTGLISIHQQFKSDQLITEIHYHPSGENVATELEAMTNPALHNTSLSIGERVKFGVANRLVLVLDGRLATNFSSGKAIVSICLPAVEIQTQQLSLPYGKSIDELIAAEARSKEEMERAERAEAFAQQQTEMLQEALGDAQSAHKTGDAIRKVTRHLKSRVKKLESQIEELETKEPEAIVIEDTPDEPVPDRSEPEPVIEEKPALILQEPVAAIDVGPKPEQRAERFESVEDVDFSLEDFAEQEAIAWLQGQIDSSK